MSQPPAPVSFGILTAPQYVSYDEILDIWLAADAIPRIEHAWLSDHLMTPTGEGPTYESWTLLSALAAQTHRLQLGVLVTSNRFRPPAVLAKIAATVDIISRGRLILGIGVGSRPGHPLAGREYEAHGLAFHDSRDAVDALSEGLTVIRRLWTETEPFDFDGAHIHLTGALGDPKPLQRPHLPVLVGGRSAPVLRLAARHADLWNIVGDDMEVAAARSASLSDACTEIGRDPATITRSMLVPLGSYDKPEITRDAIGRAIDAGFNHIVLALPNPYPKGAAQWVADELIAAHTE
ncbi:LLM class flavin-dependent oxidoreductase [Nocardia mexicana]|uniref:Luciferase-like monooxygenase n=1 Tax=Nocardia mexicana TaxID=279262 RepID=A0A370HD74_9NOCA|nr:LLM class flavin-dependent oxidoreductase [Nocardia mexicana]RDI54451.1 luciferase-like monooxygenase [Nocardia mexicana]